MVFWIGENTGEAARHNGFIHICFFNFIKRPQFK
jgi:hypothetical protein